jgi:glycosyltransferase involved in cell wall biosynthesis
MEKIKVYLQYPWVYPDSTYYKSLTTLKPDNIEYINSDKQFKTIENIKTVKKSNQLKRLIRETVRKTKLPLINAHKTKTGQFELIHCAHCLSLNKNIPWVADIESEWQLWISGESNIISRILAKRLIKRKNCKKILCWTETTKEKISKVFKDPVVDSKLDLLRFAYPANKIVNQNKRKLTLLFIGRYFFDKGGDVALEVMDRITKKSNNINVIFVSETPTEYKKKYSKNKSIKFMTLMSHNELFKKIYPKSNIFIYPGFSDSFGFMFIEAMSFGIPIITVDGFARREIVEEGKTGYIIPKHTNKEKIINDMITATEKLIKNTSLRTEMGKNAHNEVKNGKWSVKKRNDKLEEVYKKALNL